MKNVKYSKTIDWVFLFAGLIITALLIISSTLNNGLNLFDSISLKLDQQFANLMYNNNLYLAVACYISLLCWGVAILYYWVIDRFHRWWQWLITIVIVVALSPVVSFYTCSGTFLDKNLDILVETALKSFNIIVTFITLVYYIIVCFSVKRLSAHCSTTPF